jgi:hypothetical protein
MIRELRIYFRLRPILKQIEEVSRMKFSVNSTIQLLALVAQGINAVSDLLPPRGKFYAAVALAAVQGVVGVLAHFSNPDGTHATQPWVRKEE